jgi:NAD dependent epimerase/dehydratase family enzyme
LASGNQPVSWIHVDDLVEVFTQLVEQKINHGVYNAVTAFDSNKEITKKIAVLNGQSFLMPAIPSFLLRIIFGQKAEIFTGGTRISNQKLLNAGFKYQFQTLDLVMNDLNRKSAK